MLGWYRTALGCSKTKTLSEAAWRLSLSRLQRPHRYLRQVTQLPQPKDSADAGIDIALSVNELMLTLPLGVFRLAADWRRRRRHQT